MKYGFHVVVLRCSVPPGTTLDVVAPEIEAASGKKLGVDFGVCFNPEFLREGVAVADFYAPPKTVIGSSDKRSEEIVSRIYSAIDERILFISIEAAEMVKYADNVWHATKVAFGNEIGRLCKALDIDSHEVMNVFVKDTKLNLSPYYLKPGFAFGGSCLPKEVRAVAPPRDRSRRRAAADPEPDGVQRPSRRPGGRAAEALRRPADRLPRSHLQAGYRRPAREPDARADGAAAGQGARRSSPTIRTSHVGPHLQCQIDYVRHACPSQARLMDELKSLTVASVDEVMNGSDVVVVSHASERVPRRGPQPPQGRPRSRSGAAVRATAGERLRLSGHRLVGRGAGQRRSTAALQRAAVSVSGEADGYQGLKARLIIRLNSI